MKQRNPETILITGAGGQLGNELKDISGQYPQFRFLFESRQSLALEDKSSVADYFQNNHVDYCINCAAFTAVDKAELQQDMAFLVNATAVGDLAAICEEHQARLIHISTDYVYDGSRKVPLREDDPVSPLNVYGKSKLRGEELAISNNPSAIIIRTSWVYSSHGNNFLKTMMKLMSEKQELRIVSDQVGCPTYAADLAKAIMLMITTLSTGTNLSGIYNYSNSGLTTWFQFAQLIRTTIGSDCTLIPTTTEAYPTPALRPAYSVLDTTKIKKDVNPDIPFWKNSVVNCIQKMMHSA